MLKNTIIKIRFLKLYFFKLYIKYFIYKLKKVKDNKFPNNGWNLKILNDNDVKITQINDNDSLLNISLINKYIDIIKNKYNDIWVYTKNKNSFIFKKLHIKNIGNRNRFTAIL